MKWLCIALVVLALVSVGSASAGGSFERIVAVGANGASRTLVLNQSGPRSEAALEGATVSVPRGGYIRIYPFIGELPAIPGRFYPAAHALCLYWHEPVSGCSRLSARAMKVLSPFLRLPVRVQAPTVPIAVRYRSRLLRYADGNIFAAFELALERPAQQRRAVPADGVRLAVTWRGPDAFRRPSHLLLTPIGVYSSSHIFPLGRGPWCYLVTNLPNATASLIEATSRICR